MTVQVCSEVYLFIRVMNGLYDLGNTVVARESYPLTVGIIKGVAIATLGTNGGYFSHIKTFLQCALNGGYYSHIKTPPFSTPSYSMVELDGNT